MISQTSVEQALHTINMYSQPLIQHGSIALFVFLTVGILALPVPEETMLLTAGFLIGKGKLTGSLTVIAAYLGSICGISISYGIGRLGGSFLVKKYGHWIGITPEKLQRTHDWFNRVGIWILFIGYFIPVIRHLTGYLTGTMRVDFRKFALFAYTGAILWSSAFLLMGYLLSQHSTAILSKIVHLFT